MGAGWKVMLWQFTLIWTSAPVIASILQLLKYSIRNIVRTGFTVWETKFHDNPSRYLSLNTGGGLTWPYPQNHAAKAEWEMNYVNWWQDTDLSSLHAGWCVVKSTEWIQPWTNCMKGLKSLCVRVFCDSSVSGYCLRQWFVTVNNETSGYRSKLWNNIVP